jgi:hypothetical protein
VCRAARNRPSLAAVSGPSAPATRSPGTPTSHGTTDHDQGKGGQVRVLDPEQGTDQPLVHLHLGRRGEHGPTLPADGLAGAEGTERPQATEGRQAGVPLDSRSTVRARIPSVARSAASEMTGKIPLSRHSGWISDQS